MTGSAATAAASAPLRTLGRYGLNSRGGPPSVTRLSATVLSSRPSPSMDAARAAASTCGISGRPAPRPRAAPAAAGAARGAAAAAAARAVAWRGVAGGCSGWPGRWAAASGDLQPPLSGAAPCAPAPFVGAASSSWIVVRSTWATRGGRGRCRCRGVWCAAARCPALALPLGRRPALSGWGSMAAGLRDVVARQQLRRADITRVE
jgi:hypothetical protein